MNERVTACWNAHNARAIFVTEALEGNDAIFLAAHTPIQGFDVAGRDAAEFRGRDEASILETLADESRQHAFCVVQGEPGSGKSHLIRWLSVNWPNVDDIKLLLRRADGSLEGALRQLRDRLPEEFASLFDNLGQRQRASLRGRANIFLSTLANTLEPGHFDTPMPDEDWCAEFRPSALLNYQTVKSKWKTPSNILGLLEGAGGERNSATASFNLFDAQDLADLCPPPRGDILLRECEELVRRLKHEAKTIRAFREEHWLPDELEQAEQHRNQFPTSLALIGALNRRRNDAIQNVLGVSAQGLKTLFRQVREALAERNQRLVLLLEDITSWEGLDDSLIDVLVFNAAARGEEGEKPVCPLISVVGVTPAYYDKLQGNYRQRITHEIQLGRASDGLQDVATLRADETRLLFAARYLAAVRAGPAALDRWLHELRNGSVEDPPNQCETCPRQDSCFDVFGEAAGIGLFPFTAHAFERFFQALKENDNGQTWKTPRGILQAILGPNLAPPDSLEAGSYPGSFIESEAFRADRRSNLALVPQLEQIVDNKIETPAERARMRRMLAYWADPNRANTEQLGDELIFAGARRVLYEAFDLPWIGGSVTNAPSQGTAAPITVAQPILEPNATDNARAEDTDKDEETPASPVPRPRPARPEISVPKPKRLIPSKSKLEQMREQIRSWASGGTIENGNEWNKILYLLIQNIDPRAIGVTPPLFKKIVTPEMVKLEGTTTRTLNYFVLPAEPWVRTGLEAFVSLKQDTDMTLAGAEFNRRNLAVMMRRLQKKVALYLDSKIPHLDDGTFWLPVASFTQVLLARAYLRGATSPEAAIPTQISAVLSDEGESETDFSARCTPWQEWLTATKGYHERLREELREMVSLGLRENDTATGGGAALVDASELAGAVLRFAESGKFDSVPQDNSGLPDLYRKSLGLARQWSEKHKQIERVEFDQIKSRSETVSRLLRGNNVATHLDRLDRCITGIGEQLPNAAADKVQEWKQALARLQPKLDEGAGERVEDLILLLEDESLPTSLPLRLAWLAGQPARHLEDILNTAQVGERTIGVLSSHARDCVLEATGHGSLDDVKGIGRALRNSVSKTPEN